LSPADRVVVDWRISEYELVDDDETSHVDKPVFRVLHVITICSEYTWVTSSHA